LPIALILTRNQIIVHWKWTVDYTFIPWKSSDGQHAYIEY